MTPRIRADGFSLVEVLMAIALLAGALASLAQLLAMAVRANASAEATTLSAVLAVQKMEQLRGEGLLGPPGGSLQADAAGFADYLDAEGAAAAGDGSRGVSFVRRWVVEAAPFDPGRSRVLRVRVFSVRGKASDAPAWPNTGLDETRLLTVITGRER
jgi:prepilin-type N-terminal cleavage/methylation domain-containing protein